jgi:hypothetical protein
MTDPKTAARDVATRLASRDIPIKHVQALDLVAAACGYQDRSKLKDLSELPVLKRVNARLLASAATVLARHDLDRRATIVETTTDVVVPRMFDMRTVRGQGDRIGDKTTDGSVAFLKMDYEAMKSFSQGTVRRDGHAPYSPIAHEKVAELLSDRSGGGPSERGPWVIASNPDGQPSDLWTSFWSKGDLWGSFADATLYADRGTPLPKAEDRSRATVRWMNVDEAAFRAAVDMAVQKIDREDPDTLSDPDVPGERALDYDVIAAMIDLANVFDRPMGPIEIAVRDGAQRASLYTSSLSEDPGTRGGQVVEWVRDVETALADGAVPSEDRLRELLMEGDAAIANIRNWLDTDDRLWAWINVAAYPDAIGSAIDAEGHDVTEGIDMEPLFRILGGRAVVRWVRAKDEVRSEGDGSPAETIARALNAAKGVMLAPAMRDDGFLASCPAHDDRNPSLLVSMRGQDARTVCLAGCDPADVSREVAKVMSGSKEPRTLNDMRDDAAQAWFEAHWFPTTMRVSEVDGWSSEIPGDEWSRTVYIESARPARDEESEAVTYVVQFAPGSDKVVSSYAITASGNLVGRAVDPEDAGSVDLGDGTSLPISAITGSTSLSDAPDFEKILDAACDDIGHARYFCNDGLSQSDATEIASRAIAKLREAKTAEQREDAAREAVASVLQPEAAREACWRSVRNATDALMSRIDAGLEDLNERPDFERDELESVIMDEMFDRLDERDESTWRDAVSKQDKVEIYLHLVAKGDSVEETCRINHPHLNPENVVVDDEFRFVLSRLGIAVPEWTRFAKPKEIEAVRRKAPNRRKSQLVDAPRLGMMIENGCTTSFLVSLYCQASLLDVLALDLSKPIAFERVRLAIVDVMSGTFFDVKVDGIVEMQDGVDGLLTTSDCGPYADQTEDLVSSAYMSRIGSPDEIWRGPAATAEAKAHMAVEGLSMLRESDRVSWHQSGGASDGGIVLTAEIAVQDARRDASVRRFTATYETASTRRPEIEIARR